MAFTETQKTDIRRFLGYSDKTQGFFSRLEGAMVAITAEAEAAIIVILGDLATIETILRASWSRQKVLKVEDVTLAGHEEIRCLRAEGNRLARQLSITLGVEILAVYFRTGSTVGAADRG